MKIASKKIDFNNNKYTINKIDLYENHIELNFNKKFGYIYSSYPYNEFYGHITEIEDFIDEKLLNDNSIKIESIKNISVPVIKFATL